jgi:hypothetical protein
MTQPVLEPTTERSIESMGWRTRQLARRPGVPVGTGRAFLHIKVDADDFIIVAGDGRFIFSIPEDMDGLYLTAVEIYVTTSSSSGIVQVQLHNETTAADILSTRVQVDQGELNSKDASTQAVINLATAGVLWGHHIRIDVDQDGTGAMGLGVMLTYGPV